MSISRVKILLNYDIWEVRDKKNRQTIADTLIPHLISRVFNLDYFLVSHPECLEATRQILDFSH